jgi:hypothetical protein
LLTAAEQRAAELRRLGAVSICRLDKYLPASAGTEGKPSESGDAIDKVSRAILGVHSILPQRFSIKILLVYIVITYLHMDSVSLLTAAEQSRAKVCR